MWLLLVGSYTVQNVAGIKAIGAVAEAVEYNKPTFPPTTPVPTVLPRSNE